MCGHFSSQALGQYQLILFKTSFERKGVAAEAIVLTSETDSWQVSDYKFYQWGRGADAQRTAARGQQLGTTVAKSNKKA